MFVALKSGLAAKLPLSGVGKELCKVLPRNNVSKYQAATLMRAAFRNEDDIPNIKPFPYHEREFTVFTMLFLDTYKNRVNEHTKLVVIDGPPAAGKNALAKELAKEFDWLYLPQPTFDDLLVSPYGFDLRSLDHKLPKDAQSWDIERFLQQPTDRNTAMMQLYMYMMRQEKYMNALGHIFSTGQGVVTIRSPWSDAVFAKAMVKNKFISPGAFEAHTDCCDASLHFYLKPHLIIYLDVPVNTTLQNIKKRGLPHEQNSPVLNEKYLTDLAESYKTDYLSKLSTNSHLLIYDWSQGGDTEVVVEDMENLNWDKYHENDPKLIDWRFSAWQWKLHQKHYTFDCEQNLQNMAISRTDVPELCLSGNDLEVWDTETKKVTDWTYAPGYNVLKGESIKNAALNCKARIFPDNVTPLMKKYYERKQRAKTRKVS